VNIELKLIKAITEAGLAAGERAAGLSSDAHAAAEKAKALAAEAARLRAVAGTRAMGPRWARIGALNGLWSAMSSRLWWLMWSESVEMTERRAARAAKASSAGLRQSTLHDAERRRFDGLASALRAEAAGLERMPEMPKALREQAETAIRKASAAMKRKSLRAEAAREAFTPLASTARKWRRAAKARALSGGKARSGPAPAAPATLPERLYLPIPFGMHPYAKAAGARYDPEAGRGSRWFVPPGAPLSDFEEFLPLAYRSTPPKLSFPPVRHGASSQNLWSLFDKGTWNRIRQINYERTGRRCILCGKQSGNLLRYLDSQGEAKMGTVECHEIWDWSVPDPDVSIGVQRLRGIAVCCFECHQTFHDGWARSTARRRGVEDEVAKFLMKRRSFLTRKDPVQVALEMKAEAARLRAHSGVGLWIVDLSHLGQQDYVRQMTPVFSEGNLPGVKPGQIAGLDFVTDAGATWPSVTAESLHASLADLYSVNPLKRLRSPSPKKFESFAHTPLTMGGP